MRICARATVPQSISPALKNGGRGEVLQVNSKGMYLRLGDGILLVCDRSWGQIPIGILVDDFLELMAVLQPTEGQKIHVSQEQLVFPKGNIFLTDTENCQEELAAEPEISRILQGARALSSMNRSTGFSMLVNPLVLDEPYEREDPYFTRACQGFGALMRAIRQGNEAEIRENVRALLGLGSGLTPSADDIFLGMLYVFRRLASKAPGIGFFQNALLTMADTRTNQISAAYIKAVLQGAPFERMEQVYRGFCGIDKLNIEELTQIGSNSGSEMLLGMLMALRICGYE